MYDYGLGGIFHTLAARVLSGPWVNMILCNLPGQNGAVLWNRIPHPDAPWAENGFNMVPPIPPFPYGFDVEPDGPV